MYKSKMKGVLGVALTVILLASLMIGAAVTPAGADPGAGKWNAFKLPAGGGPGGYVYQAAFTNAQYITTDLNGALWAYNNDGNAATPNLYKSTDDGRSWSRKGGTLLNGVALVDIVCSSIDADTIYVASTTDVYISVNGGTSFTALVANAITLAVIQSIDVGYIGGSPYVFMGTVNTGGGAFGGLYVLGPAYGAGWTDMQVTEAANATAAAATRVDVLDVKAAPDFATSQVVVAVVSNEANTFCVTKYAGANWGANVTAAALGIVTDKTVANAATAQIAFADDFSSVTTGGLMEYFVACDTGAANTGDVFRIVLNNAFDRNIRGAATATDVTGLDIVGNIGAAYILAGRADALGTYCSTNYGSTFALSKKAPIGTAATVATWVVMAEDFADSGKAWAATSGGDSGVYLTVDGAVEWNGVGLLSTDITGVGSAINDFAVSSDGGTVFVAVLTVGGSDNLWRHDGTYWEQVYADALGNDVDLVAVTDTYDVDTTVFIADTAAMQIARSTDGGGRFSNQLGKPAAINGWLIQSPTALLTGGAAGVVHQTVNNGTTWNNRASGLAGNVVSFAKSPEYDSDSTLVFGTAAGFVARSTDCGAKWKQLPAGAAALGALNTFVCFNQEDASMVYAVNAAAAVAPGAIFRYSDADPLWRDINDITFVSPAPTSAGSAVVAAASTGIACAPDGTLYVADPTPGRGILRSINPTAGLTPVTKAPFFEAVSTSLTGTAVTAGRLIYTPGSNKVWAFDNTAARRVWYYEDAATESPTLKSPGNGTSIASQTGASLTWNAVDSATQYVVWYNRADMGWAGVTTNTSTTNGLGIATGTLSSGTTYQWMVCVDTGSPALSPWSEVFTFTTAMGAGAWNPFADAANVAPAPGASGVSIRPSFQWNPSGGATSYDFELSLNPGTGDRGYFVEVVTSATGDNALVNCVWLCDRDLEYSTTYYWHVKSTSATSKSAWATGTFTTEAAPVVPPPPPPTPEPTTPGYIWAVIGIGAALCIAVIVLIVRTRRVV